MTALAQHDNSNVEGEENEGAPSPSSQSSTFTLKEFLSKELESNADTIHRNLIQMGIKELKALLFIDEQDLSSLCNELKLSFGDKIIFKSAIRELKSAMQQHPAIVTISPKEQAMIDEVNIALKQSDDIRHIFEEHLNGINDHINTKKQNITTQINDIIKVLQNRIKTLHQKCDEWKTDKLKSVKEEITKITEYHNTLKSNKKSIDDLLRQTAVSKRERKIKEIVNGLFKNNDKYNKYQDIKALEQYMMDKTKMIEVLFEDEMNMKQLNDYGALDRDVKSDLFQIPSIVLNEINETETNYDKGYKVRLNWKIASNEEQKTNDFIIKYLQNDNDDEKHEKEWNVLDDFKINRENGNKFTMNIDKYFGFNKEYRFMVENVVEKPLNVIIQSNIQTIKIEEFKMDIYKEEQIWLNIHSHKGHHGGCVPERILQSNDNSYLSPNGQITNDWIIFSINNNEMYFPTKLQVRARGTKRDLSNGDPCALKRFGLKIGDINSNEWIDLNEEIFTASKMDSNLQTFNLDILTNKNDDIIKKWKSIKYKQYKNFKLEILDNYGTHYILIQEFKIFGVKV